MRIVFTKKGFVMVLMLSMMVFFLLMITTIVGLSCGEIIQARSRNDYISASYAAMAGAERMYARFRNMQSLGQTVLWPMRPSDLNNVPIRVNNSTVGSFSVTAGLTNRYEEFAIVSTGSVNGRTATVVARYGYNWAAVTNGPPLSSMGAINISGINEGALTSKVYADGPILSASAITPVASSPNSAPYVQYYGDVTPNKPDISVPSFWYKYNAGTDTWTAKEIYDTNGDGQYLADLTGKGYVNIADAGGDAAKIAIFNADDISRDGKIDGKDAFVSYYTVELNSKYGLQIGSGQYRNIQGDKSFGQTTELYNGRQVYFVNGKTYIGLSAKQWSKTNTDLTIISTGDLTLLCPVNGVSDRLVVISYGNILTGGTNLGSPSAPECILHMYAKGDITFDLGGNTGGSVVAGGKIDIWTRHGDLVYNRNFRQGVDDWQDPAFRPVTLPPDYPMTTKSFTIKTESFGGYTYKPRWQQ